MTIRKEGSGRIGRGALNEKIFSLKQQVTEWIHTDMFVFIFGASHRKNGIDFPTVLFWAISILIGDTIQWCQPVWWEFSAYLLTRLTTVTDPQSKTWDSLPSFSCPSEKGYHGKNFHPTLTSKWGKFGHVVSYFIFKITIRYYLKYNMLY